MRWLLALFLLAPAAASGCERSLALTLLSPPPGLKLIQVAEGGLARELLDFINRQPPVSDLTGDRVAIFYLAVADFFQFVIADGDCATKVIQMPASVFSDAVGDPA